MSPAFHVQPLSSRQSGFALVVALSLMAFVLLLLLSISTLVSVETSSADLTKKRMEARQNAMMAALVALGDLSKVAGADQRVTARADIEEASAPFWTGVWSSDPEEEDGSVATSAEIKDRPALKWLVSVSNEGEAALLQTYANQDLSNVPAGSVVLNQNADNPIILPTESIEVAGAETGGYAYWVADEGVKASVYLPADDTTRETNLKVRNPANMDLTIVDGFVDVDVGDIEYMQASVDRMSGLGTLPLVLDVDDEVSIDRIHDLTPVAKALQVNVRDGGLKKDLSAAFENAGNSWQKLLDFHGSTQLFPPASGTQTERDPGGPLWAQLRSYYQSRPLSDGTVAPLEVTDEQSGIGPVLSHFSLHHHIIFYDTGADQYRPRLCVFPIFVLWNPYNKAIRAETYYLKVTDTTIVNNEDSLTMSIRARVYQDRDDGAADTLTETSGNNTYFYKESQMFPNTEESPYYFKIETSGIGPGEALIFSADSIEALPTDPSEPIVLSPGFYEGNFFYKDAPDTLDLSNLKKAGEGDEVDKPELNYFALYMRSANFLRVRVAKDSGDSGDPASHLDDEILLQHVSGQNSFVIGSGWQGTAPVRWPGNIDMLVPAGEEDDAIIAGHPAYDQSSFPASGAYMHLKMVRNYAEVNNNDDLTTSQRDFMPYIKYVANSNPRAPRSSRGVLEETDFGNNNGSDMAFNPTYFGNSEMYHWSRLLPSNHSYRTFISGDDSVNLGFSDDPGDFADNGWVLYEVPEDGAYFLSIADLAMANLTQPLLQPARFYKNPTLSYNIQNLWPAFSIGNSLQDPRIPADTVAHNAWPGESGVTDYYHYDVSYLLNEALWDVYFFSAYKSDASLETSWNVRYETADDFTYDFDESAQGVVVAGSFNVNATSVEAWKAILASARGRAVDYAGNQYNGHDDVPFLSVGEPVGGPAPFARDSESEEVYKGFLSLDSTDIDALAEAIVEQVKARGPFVSLSHFINRVLDDNDYRSMKEADYADSGDDGERAMMVGALQAAIELSEVNEQATDGTDRFDQDEYKMLEADLQMFYGNMSVDASLGDRAAGNPGYLSQLNLLDAMGPFISVRSDTFAIYAYGESRNPLTGVSEASARCKIIVQRVAEYVDSGDTPTTEPDALSSLNQDFGRRFQIIDFQWTDDII